MHKPFYDPYKSYITNYNEGPFNAFADGNIYQEQKEPNYTFLGKKVYVPFGIPAGPLLNSNYIKAAFEKGFDICVYKTVRTSIYPSHPYPNLLAIHKDKISLEDMTKTIAVDNNFVEPLSITNSFGVPSKDPTIWQEDVKKALTYETQGKAMILSFMGTVRSGQTQENFIQDYITAATLAKETKVTILEVNLSCPNIGNLGLVCYNLEVTEKILNGIKQVIGNTPLIAKIGYYQDQTQLEKLAAIVNEYAQSIAAINTLQAAVVKDDGKQALPGKQRLRSGICGHAIKWAGIDMVERLKKIKENKGYTFSIEGVGGVTTPQDYKEYKQKGADSVMSATGAMWNPFLAQEIKKEILYI